MADVTFLSLDSMMQGFTEWVKQIDRNPTIQEQTENEGFFWTCDFTKESPKPMFRRFEENVWYAFRDSKERKGWYPEYNFTHWMRQEFSCPEVSEEEVQALRDHMVSASQNHSNRYFHI